VLTDRSFGCLAFLRAAADALVKENDLRNCLRSMAYRPHRATFQDCMRAVAARNSARALLGVHALLSLAVQAHA
jgi:hypothetical protein